MEILEEVKDGKLTLEEMNNELDTKIYDYKLIKSLLMGNIEEEQRLLTRNKLFFVKSLLTNLTHVIIL